MEIGIYFFWLEQKLKSEMSWDWQLKLGLKLFAGKEMKQEIN